MVPIDAVTTARHPATSAGNLPDDSPKRAMGVAKTKKATSEKVASDGLLRLGLNQRPSD